MRSLSLAWPNARSPLDGCGDPTAATLGVDCDISGWDSEIVGGNLIGAFLLSGRGPDRANDAVDDSMGVA